MNQHQKQGFMAKLKRTRNINTSQVIRQIWTHGEISRVQIAKNLELDKSTISSIVSDLLEIGIISETTVGEAGPQGGRKPVHLRINASYGSVLGIEMRPEGYAGVAVDLEGKVIGTWTGATPVTGDTLRQVFLTAAQRMRAEMAGRAPLLGVGVGLSGVVNPHKGVIRYSIPLRVEKPWDFHANVSEAYDLPIFIENDANACAWGELAFHRSRKLRDFLFVLVEFREIREPQRIHERTSVGMGLVVGSRVHYGHDYSAGEFRSILRTESSLGQFSLSPDEAARVEEDPVVLDRFLRELSRNIALLVNTFNMGDVFLGGHIERYREQVAGILAEEIQRNWPYPDAVRCAVHFSSLGDRAVAYGAAGMLLDRLLRSDTWLGAREAEAPRIGF
jgi:predicted NBD/HSP70 family sugar kinase